MLILIGITLALTLISIILFKKDTSIFAIPTIIAVFFVALIIFNSLLLFGLHKNIDLKTYEQVIAVEENEQGVIEIIENQYYKDKNGDYYILSKERPKLSKNLWNIFVYSEMERIDKPITEAIKR